MPNRYLVLAGDGMEMADLAPYEVAGWLFFQMWQRRQPPYREIVEGDIAYLADKRSRTIVWEVRVRALLTDFAYRSTRHALGALRSAYGVYAEDLNDYHHTRSGAGHLLAWSSEPRRRLDVSVPRDLHFGRNRYRRLDDVDLERLALPSPSRRVMAKSPDWYEPAAARSGLRRPPSRYITMDVRRQVRARDGGRCVGCGTTRGLHFDHVVPFHLGGNSKASNIRLLCAQSNLRRPSMSADEPLDCAA